MAYRRRTVRTRRRPAYRRRTGYRRTMTRRLPMGRKLYSAGRSSISQNLAVYHNPFSTATTSPRIPDNKVYSSCGVRLQAVGEFVNDSEGTMDFLIFPGINNMFAAQGVASGGSALSNLLPFTNHASFILSGTTWGQPPETSVHKWRGVSFGCKFTLVNNSDENDGWWEAIRVQGSDTSGFGMSIIEAGRAVIAGSTSTSFPAINVGITNMPEHPTYVTGKLRDIHKYAFNLNPQGSDHEFEIFGRENTAQQMTETALDNENFDMIYVRVHGRAGVNTPTRIMAHVVANQELIYDEASSMSRYHSNTRGSSSAMAVARKRLMENSANQRAAKRPRTAYASYPY